jgi:hypothetical protein
VKSKLERHTQDTESSCIGDDTALPSSDSRPVAPTEHRRGLLDDRAVATLGLPDDDVFGAVGDNAK